MDGYRGGGCCIARYSGNGGGGASKMLYGMSNVDKIMLKFRPIAPKPMASGSGTSSCSTVENRDTHGRTQRRKRKYVRSGANKTKKETKTSNGNLKKRKVSTPSSPCTPGSGEPEMKVVTLSLMPETPDRKESSPITSLSSEKPDLVSLVNKVGEQTKANEFVEFQLWNKQDVPELNLLSFNNKQQKICHGQVPEAYVRNKHVLTPVRNKHVFSITDYVTDRKKLQIISYVTMECVTNTWMNGDDLGFVMDKTQVMSMEMDTCPSFLTDGRDTVVWTNKAYKEMTAGAGGGGGCLDAMEVVMVVKKYNRVTMPVCHTAGFTCKVKVTWGMGRGASPPSTVTAPCDVWRLQGGGFAWRLDVKAALSLGL